MRSRVIANCAVVNPHYRGPSGAVIANAAAVISGCVAGNDAIIERHCRRTSVVYTAAVAKCRVIVDPAITKSQRGMIVVDAATIGNRLFIGVAVGDVQLRNGDDLPGAMWKTR